MKPLAWIGSSLKDLKKLPKPVKEEIFEGLYIARDGGMSTNARTMQGDLRDVTEIRVDDRSGTYRATYTTRIGSKTYVLHVFQKKSTQGIATPKRDLDLIRKRLQAAREIAKAEKL